MEPDYWIELENTYTERISQRQAIHTTHRSDVLQALPGTELACKELMEMVIQFLCARYPRLFTLQGMTFSNHILGTTHEIPDIDPLMFLLENVPEDFAIMLRDPETGRYYFRAGIICASTGWNLATKIGLGLADIHNPVPDYKEKMQLSMDRYVYPVSLVHSLLWFGIVAHMNNINAYTSFFTKMPTSKPIQRGSWLFEVGQHLYVAPNHPSFDLHANQDPSLSIDDLYPRVDWQTLRRLPLSGAIVFNFKAFFTPLSKLKHEPYIPSLSLKVLNEGKVNLIQYKSIWHMDHVLKPALAEYERYQIEKGIIEREWQPQTLQETPFYPGWKKQ
ncbi:uncharacterized protein N0V89_007974 [Didymosphaeria variabile]|uniref:Uncharacterized protein n=1 Tax=Didymosphaeria variabile TaxID=1932322 RepID=A0A9W8XFF2_9PLEO|nr:uncharacterized protein N0V89_007974 [Didymosphaeria variabile]KAJ4349360.1 hypothetical protein N0V89_007974 [Didymosphaeria variabile]